jgi:hypothetical protein
MGLVLGVIAQLKSIKALCDGGAVCASQKISG